MSWISPTYKLGKETAEKAKKLNIEKMQENADKIRDMVKGLDTSQLKLLKSKTGDIFKETPSKVGKWIKRILAGAGIGAGGKAVYEVGQETMRKAKGGHVRKMKRGGSVRRMNAGGAVNSRAIAKKYFKGGMV